MPAGAIAVSAACVTAQNRRISAGKAARSVKRAFTARL
jgi:hypothetical protein